MSTKSITLTKAVQYISSREQITSPGKYDLQVTSVNFLEDSDKYIVNLKAMSPTETQQARELLHAGEYQDATNKQLSTNVFADASYIPTQYDYVTVMIKEVPRRDGGTRLGVVSMNEIKAKATTKVNFADEFANLLAEEPAEQPAETMPELS